MHTAFCLDERMVIEPTDSGLYCAAGGFHVDPWQPVERAVITHAHGDHLRPGSRAYLCTRDAEPFVPMRLDSAATVSAVAYGETTVIDGVKLSLHPSGHIRGAAQVRVEHRGEVWVAAGDYKRQSDPTCAPFEVLRCHAFISEATFALPIFRWAPAAAVVQDICAWWDETRAAGRPSVLFTYALGKSQRVLAELARYAERPVYVHGSLSDAIDLYRAAGVRLIDTRRAAEESRGRSFAGELIVAPVSARGTLWMRRFGDHSSAFASGWMRLRGARRRRAYDRGFTLSDHADWDDLLATVHDTGAERVFVTHGYTEPLARYLRGGGIDAHPWRTSYEGEAAAE